MAAESHIYKLLGMNYQDSIHAMNAEMERLSIEKYSQYKGIVHLGDSKIEILEAPFAKTKGISSCCAFAIYCDSSPKYIFGHIPSFKDGFSDYMRLDKTLARITDDQPGTYKAIIIGGSKNTLQQISQFLLKRDVKLSASYYDDFCRESQLEESICAKNLIYDHTQKSTTVLSTEFLRLGYQLTINTGDHLDFEKNFQDCYIEAKQISKGYFAEVLGSEDEAENDERSPSP